MVTPVCVPVVVPVPEVVADGVEVELLTAALTEKEGDKVRTELMFPISTKSMVYPDLGDGDSIRSGDSTMHKIRNRKNW